VRVADDTGINRRMRYGEYSDLPFRHLVGGWHVEFKLNAANQETQHELTTFAGQSDFQKTSSDVRFCTLLRPMYFVGFSRARILPEANSME
jgi:hypothetical protein